MRKYTLLAAILLIACPLTGSAQGQHAADKNKAKLPTKELRELSHAISSYKTYTEKKQAQIEAITDSFELADNTFLKWELAIRLSRVYRNFNTDSALYYSYKSLEFAQNLNNSERQQAEITIVDALATAGLFSEATRRYAALSLDSLPNNLKINYWVCGRRLYGYMNSYVKGNESFVRIYNERYLQCDDSLLKYLPRSDNFREFISCERLVTEGRFNTAETDLKALMDKLPNPSNLYAMAAYQLSMVYATYGNEEKYAAMLALSAKSDIECAIKEGLALPTLAYWLYQQGEIDDAFKFINFALDDAIKGNTRMRAVTMAQFVPIIDEAYRKQINDSKNLITVFLVLAIVLFAVTSVLTGFLGQQMNRSRQNEKKIAQIAERQKSYIGNFIGLYSSYADKLNRFTKLVSMKLASGQTAELSKLINSGKFADQDNDDIHKIFDSAFLDIYPDFVDNINSLLREEERIAVKDKHSLTPELRIYAFVILGVEESLRIAQILHYSANTVYAYRNKIRNRAINRDTFDLDVKALGRTS